MRDDPFPKILFIVAVAGALFLGWMRCQPPPCLEYEVDASGEMDCYGNEFYMHCTPKKRCIRRAEGP